MKDKDQLITEITQQALLTSTPTSDGQTTYNSPEKTEVIQAINQLFAEFELIYHNQFIKAYATQEKLSYAKRLWFSYLYQYQADSILQAGKAAVKQSEFLPTINVLLYYLENTTPEGLGLPDAYAAYREACNAPSPKANFQWSHPAVYHAGLQTGWFLLASENEKKMLPIFKRNYRQLCYKVANGDVLNPPDVIALEPDVHHPLENNEQKKRLVDLKNQFGL